MVAHPREKIRAHRLRPLTPPRRLQVESDDAGVPRTIRFEGELRTVAAVQDRWRIDDEWWRERPVSRCYYHLQLEGGHGTPAGAPSGEVVITVYRDLIEGDWWLQRY